MPTIQSIRARRAKGETIVEIVEHEGVSVPTARKYLTMKDFSPALPIKQERPSIIDPYKNIIKGYLDENERSWHKQRHSAKRIHERLVIEHGAKIGYATVQLYVKKRREEGRSARDQYLKLVWAPSEAQVDFGEADIVAYDQKLVCQQKWVDSDSPFWSHYPVRLTLEAPNRSHAFSWLCKLPVPKLQPKRQREKVTYSSQHQHAYPLL